MRQFGKLAGLSMFLKKSINISGGLYCSAPLLKILRAYYRCVSEAIKSDFKVDLVDYRACADHIREEIDTKGIVLYDPAEITKLASEADE